MSKRRTILYRGTTIMLASGLVGSGVQQARRPEAVRCPTDAPAAGWERVADGHPLIRANPFGWPGVVLTGRGGACHSCSVVEVA